MKCIELQNLLREQIKSVGSMFHDDLADRIYCGMHNLPKNGKWLVISVNYKWDDYDLFFETREDLESFKEILYLFSENIYIHDNSKSVWKDV
jgi:hypothetical protein